MRYSISNHYLIELNNVGMSHFLEDLDFPCDSLDIFFVLDFFFFKNFDSDLKENVSEERSIVPFLQ